MDGEANLLHAFIGNSDSEADFDGFKLEDINDDLGLPLFDALDIEGDVDLVLDMEKRVSVAGRHSVHGKSWFTERPYCIPINPFSGGYGKSRFPILSLPYGIRLITFLTGH